MFHCDWIEPSFSLFSDYEGNVRAYYSAGLYFEQCCFHAEELLEGYNKNMYNRSALTLINTSVIERVMEVRSAHQRRASRECSISQRKTPSVKDAA